ncbi:MAG: 30S ribosomal protein S16 [Chloroflexi bacterium]|nr:30S ribosomal protein S16 [Chloroflexota bacterium]
MLRIRLTRVGKKKQPAYRLVVADSRSPRDGAFLKIIGHYNPLTDPATLVVKEEEAVHWLQKGAQPSQTVAKLLSRLGVMEKAGLQPVVYRAEPAAPKPKARAAKAAREPAAAVTPASPPAAAPEAPPAAEAKEPAAVDQPAAPETAEETAPAPVADEPQEQPEATE